MKIFQKRPAAALIMVLAILLGLSVGRARQPGEGPAVQGQFAYVLHNETGALSQKTIDHVESMNESLFAQTGAQIVLDVVETTGSQDIGDYAEALFVSRGIGSRERDNGILLVLALRNLYGGAPDGEYYIAWGGGFRDSQLDDMEDILYDSLEAGFAAKRYDDAVRKTFDNLVDYLEDLYGVTVREGQASAPGNYQAYSGDYAAVAAPSPVLTLGTLTGLLVLLFVLWLILDAMRYSRYRRRYLWPGCPPPPRYYPVFWGRPRRPRRPPPPPPPPGHGGFHPGGSFGGGAGRPPRPGGFHPGGSFGGGAGRTSRPSGGFHSGGSFGGGAGRTSRPSGGARRPSGGARRPSGGGAKRSGGSFGGGRRRR